MVFPTYPFEFTNWIDEELSWHDNCYIHAGLNPFPLFDIKGIDLLRLYNDVSVGTFDDFPIGKARHAVLCTEEGLFRDDGILVRRSEDEFISMCLPDPQALVKRTGKSYDFTSEYSGNSRFFFQLCGPRSLEIVEQACRADLHDLKFMHTANTQIDGHDVFILRTGMAGTLGYEVHGLFEDAVPIYSAIMAAGASFGIRELGRHAYRNAHTEGSIPQVGTHWFSVDNFFPIRTTGSLPRGHKLVHRSPIDLGWANLIKFDHDFIGRAALEAEAAGHHNEMVTLIWDLDDVAAIQKAVFDKDNPAEHMDMVEDYDPVGGNSTIRMDAVYDGERFIGASSGRMLSPKSREMISLCTIDQDYAVEGKMVEVLWGSPGTRQMRVKAIVSLFPYIKEGRNDSFDVEAIPRFRP
jgi:glycine cleavage system aminomethyltransferase T